MFDLKIINGLIIDGTGKKAYAGDVGIVGDKIAAIGDLKEYESKACIDAAGRVVAPGFIDMHTHSDFSFVYDPKANSHLYNGVTMDVISNCGIGPAPIGDDKKDTLIAYLGTRLVGSIPVELKLPWNSLKEYLDTFRENKPCINIAPLVAQGAVRIAVMGLEKGDATPEQLEVMKKLTREAMEDGALGLSTGLVYMPGEYTSKEEVAELCKVIKPYGGVYCTHMRTESDGILDAIDEALWIGKEAGVPVEISHLKLLSQNMLGKTQIVLDKFAQAEAEGVEVNFDIYPYTAGLTSLAACLPPWLFEGGVDKLLERIKDKEIRVRIAKEIEESIPGWQNFVKSAGGWKKFFVSSVTHEENKKYEGMFITEIAEMQGKEPLDAACDLLLAENGRVQMNYYAMDEDDVMTFMKQPNGSIGSDTMSLNVEGVLNFGKPHPRGFGSHARFLGRYVRDKQLMPLEEAVRKMTSLPAQKLHMNSRGMLKPGYFADIVVFDADKIIDQATYTEPQQYSAGVEYVVVNGQIALKEGQQTGVCAGQVVTR